MFRNSPDDFARGVQFREPRMLGVADEDVSAGEDLRLVGRAETRLELAEEPAVLRNEEESVVVRVGYEGVAVFEPLRAAGPVQAGPVAPHDAARPVYFDGPVAFGIREQDVPGG